METLELTPAYGRDYKSQKEVKAAFEGGKDFVVATFGPEMGRYCNIRDFKVGQTVLVRYKQLTQVMAYKVKGKK